MKKSKNLRVPVFAAVLAALSIVLGKFAAINIGDTIRISFENLPIILSSVILGPIWGALCGVCADLLGCVLRGFAINPLITVVQAVMGILPGVLTRYVFRSTSARYAAASTAITHVICSMGLKTVALHIVFTTPYAALFATRIPSYLLVGAAEAYICFLLLKSSIIRKEFSL